MAFELISYRYKGKTCWTLLDCTRSTSPMYVLVYSALKLKRRSTNTQHHHATALKQFYEYIQLKHQRTVECYIVNLGLWSLINELDGFATYLEAGQQDIKVVALPSAKKNSADTNRSRIERVCAFLGYLNVRYTTQKYNCVFTSERDARIAFNTNRFLIKTKREDLTNSGSKKSVVMVPTDYNSLTSYQVDALLKVIYPHTYKNINPLNPFRSVKVSFRNYLIAVLLLEYGLRRSEVRLLTTFSFKPNLQETAYYLVVDNYEDEFDKGSEDPSIKTAESYRTLRLTKEHYNLLCHYVTAMRSESDSSRLFLRNESSEPLSMRMINKVFESITRYLHLHFQPLADMYSMEYLETCHPHQLRHTWAISQLAYLCQVLKKTLDEAKDLIRINGGWSIKSNMPDYYGRRYIAEQANAMNIQRIMSNNY